MMTKEEINKAIILYSKTIKDAINKVNINNYSLSLRCINKEDVFQEVCIYLWKNLATHYDKSRMGLEEYISYQSSWYAKKFYSNILRSSRCLTGSKIHHKGRAGSQQGKIDTNKVSYDEVPFMKGDGDSFDVKSDKKNVFFFSKGNSSKFLNSFISFCDTELDYEMLIEEIKAALNEKYHKQVYIDIFNELIEPSFGFDVKDKSKKYVEGLFYKKLAEKYGYKHVENLRYVVNSIKKVILEVIEKYNS